MPEQPINPLIGDTVNPLALQNSKYEVPDLPTAPIYKAPTTGVTQADVNDIDNKSKDVFADKIKGLIKKVEDIPKWGQDLTPYGKVVSYDADHTGANFQRFYNHSKFQELGFSPFRDNETLYNQKGSWADDAGRMLRGWGSLFATGAMDGIKSWADNPFDPETDNATAADMDRKLGQMTSSRGGFGAGVINFGANTAYSMGLVTEFMAETAVLAAATAITFGADAPVTVSVEAARAATLGSKLGKMGKSMSNTYKTLTSLRDLNTAKNFFKSVNAGEVLGKAIKFINPLENTTAFIKDANKAMKAGEQVYNMAKVAKGFGAFVNDIRQTQLVMSEANLEGGTVENQMITDMTDDFYRKNGRMPDARESYDIHNMAGIAGNKTIAWNIPALYLSNKIVLENAFKGFKPMSTIAAESSEGLAGKLVFNQAWKKAGVNPWSVVEGSWKANLKSLTKASTWAPKGLVKNIIGKSLSYTSKNLTEAFQEQYQEAVSGSMSEYYKKIYEDPSKAGSDEMGSIFTDNLSKQFTTMQGFETFASGFFMGGVLQGPQKLVFSKIPQKIFQMKNPAEYAERQAQKKEWTDKVVESLNEVTKDPAVYFNNNSENMVIQRNTNNGMREANENNDEKSFRDQADESVFNHLHTVINSGKFDLILENLKGMKEMSSNDLRNAFGEVPKNTDPNSYYTNKVDNLIDRAKSIKNRNDAINDKFVNPFNPNKFSKTDNNTAYVSEYMRWKAYEDAKKAAVYSEHSFDRTLERMASIISDVTKDIPISKASSTDFTMLFDDKAIDNELGALDVEMKAFSDGTSQQKQQVKQSTAKLEALEELRANINNYRHGLASSRNVKKVEERNRVTTIKKGAKVKNTVDGSTGTVKKVTGKYAIMEDGTKVNRKYLESTDKNAVTGHHMDEALEMLHNSYTDYLKVIANINKDHLFNDKVNESFAKLKDYYTLEHDSNDLANTINLLHNPKSFIDYSKQMEEVRKSLYDKRKDHMKKALEEYMKMKDQNELLNKLLEDGVYIHPDDIKPLLDDKIIPDKLFDVINYEELTTTSEKYQKGLATIKQWIDVTKESIVVPNPYEVVKTEPVPKHIEPITGETKIKPNTPLSEMPEELVDQLLEAFRAENRTRESNGENFLGTYKPTQEDHVVTGSTAFKQFVSNFSKANTIITSYNTKNNRTVEPIAKEIKKPENTVASVPLIITNDMKQKLSSLGYSKEDVDRMRPAEANHLISGNIVKQEKQLTPEEDIERRRQEELKNAKYDVDTKVSDKKADIGKLSQEEFAKYLQDNHSDNLKQEQIYKLLTVRPELREAMLNESPEQWSKRFEKNIDYKQQHNNVDNNKELRGTSNPAWTGISIGNPDNQATDGRHKGYVTVTQESTRDLAKNVEQTFKDLYQKLKEAGYNGHLKMPSTFSDLLTRFDNIVIHGATQNDVDIAMPIIQEYLNGKNITVESTKTGIDAKDTNGKETSHTNLLAEKVKNKSLLAEEHTYNSGAERYTAEINAKYDAELAALNIKDDTGLRTIEEIFRDAKTLEDIEQAEEEVLATLADPEARRKIGLTNEFLMNLIESKKKELLLAFTYEDIIVGDVLAMIDGSKMLVVEKTDTQLKLRKFGDEGENYTIVPKDVVSTTIKYKYKEGMENVNIKIPVTENEKQISNQSVKNFTEFNEDDDATSVEEDMKKASGMSPQDRNDDLTNILGCK